MNSKTATNWDVISWPNLNYLETRTVERVNGIIGSRPQLWRGFRTAFSHILGITELTNYLRYTKISLKVSLKAWDLLSFKIIRSMFYFVKHVVLGFWSKVSLQSQFWHTPEKPGITFVKSAGIALGQSQTFISILNPTLISKEVIMKLKAISGQASWHLAVKFFL